MTDLSRRISTLILSFSALACMAVAAEKKGYTL